MEGTMTTKTTGITRRDLLKRGALVGGAVLWATPVVQVVGMGRAYAKDVSPNCSRFCLKWNVDANEETGELTCTNGLTISAYPVWSSNWEELGNGEGNSLTCPDDGVNNESAARDITNSFSVYGSPAGGFWVAFPKDVKPADLEDEAPPWSAAVKCGQEQVQFKLSELFLEDDPCLVDANSDPYLRIFIPACDTGHDISHLELIVDWCP
jgi:hypothetical protein